MIIIAKAIARRNRGKMKKQVVIVPDNVGIYIRVGNLNQIDEKNILLLQQSEAIDLYRKLKKGLSKVPYLSLEGDDR